MAWAHERLRGIQPALTQRYEQIQGVQQKRRQAQKTPPQVASSGRGPVGPGLDRGVSKGPGLDQVQAAVKKPAPRAGTEAPSELGKGVREQWAQFKEKFDVPKKEADRKAQLEQEKTRQDLQRELDRERERKRDRGMDGPGR